MSLKYPHENIIMEPTPNAAYIYDKKTNRDECLHDTRLHQEAVAKLMHAIADEILWRDEICEVLEETLNCTVKVCADLFYVCCREYLNYNEHLLNNTLKDFNVKFTCYEVTFHQEDIAEIVDHAESYKMMYKFSFEKMKEEG